MKFDEDGNLIFKEDDLARIVLEFFKNKYVLYIKMIYKTYNTDLNNINDYLNKNGVAVIPNILTDNECYYFRNQIWDDIKYVSQNRFDISSTSNYNET
jgi:predicted nucleotide-binding protein (sugar kinase/HSP70/actin superfamily)